MEPEFEPDDRIVTEIEVVGLKREVAEVVGGEMTIVESPELDPVVAAQFWQNVLTYEKLGWTTYLEILARHGVDVLEPDRVPDWQVHDTLWKVIRALEQIGVYLENTDHLSDRELYGYLVTEALREKVKDISPGSGWSWQISPIGSGSEEDMLVYHRYYATPGDRRLWMRDFPDYKMPKREKRPYDRDRHLAKWVPPMMEFADDDGGPNSG